MFEENMGISETTGFPSDGQIMSKAQAALGNYRPPTPRQKLLKLKGALTAQLIRVESALTVLDANPGMEEFLDVTQGLI